MLYNQHMNNSDERTLSQFIKAKLKMDAKAFGESVGLPRATLYWQWKHENAKIRDLVELYYHKVYDQL